MDGPLRNDLHLLHLLHREYLPRRFLNHFPNFTKSSLSHHELESEAARSDPLGNLRVILLCAASVCQGSVCSQGLTETTFEFTGRFERLYGVQINVAACVKMYRKLPKSVLLSFCGDPTMLFLRVCLVVASMKISESLVVRTSLLRLELFRSKLRWRGLVGQFFPIQELSNNPGDYLRAYRILLIPWNDMIKLSNAASNHLQILPPFSKQSCILTSNTSSFPEASSVILAICQKSQNLIHLQIIKSYIYKPPMFLTSRQNNLISAKRPISQPQNTSITKKKSFLSLVSKSRSRQKSNQLERACTKGSSMSIERLNSNLGSQTAIDLSNFPSEKNIAPLRREAYHHKNTKGHKVQSLVLDHTQFDKYSLQQTFRPLWNKNSPINKLITETSQF